jgi:dihydropyrimidinase
MAADTIIKNCKLVRPEGVTSEGIAIEGEKIVAIGSDDSLPEAKLTIDAERNYVIPGIVDNHIHTGGYHPLDEDTRVDTAAAAYGGVTTICNMIGIGGLVYKDSYTGIFDDWKKIQEQNGYTDFVMNLVIHSETHLREIPLYAGKYGILLFKLLLHYKGLEAEARGLVGVDDGTLYVALDQVRACGPPARLMLHCENIEVIRRLMPKLKDEQKREDLAAWSDSRPGWVEATHIERVASFAKIVKAPIYIVHVSSAQGVDAVAKAKAEGVDIIAETCPHYLTLTKYSPIGVLGKVNPPLRDEASIERLWEGIRLDIVQCMGTDHGSPMKTDKIKGGIWAGPTGLPGIENYLPVLLSEGVNKGRITLQKLVEVSCVNNAKAMGIYPRKGAIRVGSDADLVIIDLNKRVKLSAKTLHQLSDFCIYEGWEVRGYPVLTMLRGNIVVKDGKLVAKAGIGKYIPRFL